MVLILMVGRFSMDMELLREQLGFVLSSVFYHGRTQRLRKAPLGTETIETYSLVITALSLLLSDKQEGRLLAQN